MSKKRGTNSIYLLALRTLPHLKIRYAEISLVFIMATILSLFSAYLGIPNVSEFVSVGVFLSGFNGAILGIVVAGYSIFSALPNSRRTLFMITDAPSNSRFSYYKMSLLYGFKMTFWIFNCTFLIILLLGFAYFVQKGLIKTAQDDLKFCLRFLGVFSLVAAQIKIFVELKNFIFITYLRAITEARLFAKESGVEPHDKGMD